MRRIAMLLAAGCCLAAATPTTAQPLRPEPVEPPPLPAVAATPTPSRDGREPPPPPPALSACSQAQVDAAVAGELETRPASRSRTVGGVVAGTAGSIAGGAVAGPVGAAVGGTVAGTVGRVVTSAVTGESQQAERDERRARDTLRWCTADGRMLSLDPVAPRTDTGRSPSS